MQVRGLTVIGILLASVLAGCTTNDVGLDDDDDPILGDASDPTPPDGPDPERAAGRYVPWTISDHWTFDMEARGFAASESRLVYYEEVGPEYQVGSTTYEEALHQAVFGVNPLLGRIHKGMLSPHTRGEHADLFPFGRDGVLVDGAVWSTVIYDRQMTFTASYDEAIPTPTGTEPGYRFEGTDRAGFRMAHSYVPSVKWFTYLTASDEDGTVLDLQLRSSGTGYTGPAHFIRSSMLFGAVLETDLLPLETATFRVDADLVSRDRVEGLGIHAVFHSDPGLFGLVIVKDPEGNEIYRRQHDDPPGTDVIWPGGARPSGTIGERPQWPAGTYTIEFVSLGGVIVDLVIVATQDNSGRV